LPTPLSSLIGREDEIIQLAELLDTPETRLATLTGLGGVGKTRLALSVAQQLRRDGRTVCFVPLAGAPDASFLLSNLAAALNLPGEHAEDPWEAIVGALEDRSLVLVLDNVEHLLPHAASTIRRLLEEIPTLVCVTTSRQRIGLAGEHEYPVRP